MRTSKSELTMENNDLCILQYMTKLICLGVMQLLKEISAQHKALIFSWKKKVLKKKPTQQQTTRTFY